MTHIAIKKWFAFPSEVHHLYTVCRFQFRVFRVYYPKYYFVWLALNAYQKVSHPPRGRPEWRFKKPEPEPDFLSKISVLINRNRIFSFPIRFLINRNRNFERSIRFLINRNRNSGWLPDFRFLIRFGYPLFLRAADTNMHTFKISICKHTNMSYIADNCCICTLRPIYLFVFFAGFDLP